MRILIIKGQKKTPLLNYLTPDYTLKKLQTNLA